MPSPNQIPKGKKQITVTISKDLYEELIVIAPVIYGKGRGGISYIIEEALKYYLKQYQGQTK